MWLKVSSAFPVNNVNHILFCKLDPDCGKFVQVIAPSSHYKLCAGFTIPSHCAWINEEKV